MKAVMLIKVKVHISIYKWYIYISRPTYLYKWVTERYVLRKCLISHLQKCNWFRTFNIFRNIYIENIDLYTKINSIIGHQYNMCMTYVCVQAWFNQVGTKTSDHSYHE